MPHIRIEYSPNLECDIDFGRLCEVLRDAAADTGIFRLEGIRVRAFKCDHYLVADGADGNSFLDISVRIRGGRSIDVRQSVTTTLFEAAELFLEPVLKSRATALSLELLEIDPEFSPKINSIGSPNSA